MKNIPVNNETRVLRRAIDSIVQKLGFPLKLIDSSELEFPDRYGKKKEEAAVDFLLHEEIDGVHALLLHVDVLGNFWLSLCHSPLDTILHSNAERNKMQFDGVPVRKHFTLFTRETYFECKRKLMKSRFGENV